MRKQFWAVLLSALLICLLVSCGDKGENKEIDASADAELTVSDIVSLFDEELFLVQTYDSQMIEPIRQKLELEGEIASIVHIVNQKTSAPNLEWVYVYEFTEEADATAFDENRQAFVTSTEGGVSFRRGNIVVFGNSPVIAEFDK